MPDAIDADCEPVPNKALVLMNFDPFETMTELICKYVLGEMFAEWDV